MLIESQAEAGPAVKELWLHSDPGPRPGTTTFITSQPPGDLELLDLSLT